MSNQNSTINDSGITEQLWLKEFKKKAESMLAVTTELPEKSLKRMQHSNDMSFHESVN